VRPERLSEDIVEAIERFVPEPFTFAILMTALTAVLVLATTATRPDVLLSAWGEGLAMLLPFITQMALMVLFSFALGQTEIVRRLVLGAASLPRTPYGAYVFCVSVTGAISLFAWPLGLVAGSLVARAVGASARERGIVVHYPLLAAASFGGFVVWHMGYSGSAPLFVATPGNAMEAQIGGLVPVTETVFTLWNAALAGLTLAAVAGTACLMHPRDPAACEASTLDAVAPATPPHVARTAAGPARALEDLPWCTLALGLALVLYLTHRFATRGFELTLDVVNWSILAVLCLVAGSARRLIDAISTGGPVVTPVLVQYPLYGGIMGMIVGTGFVQVLSASVLTFASAGTLPVIAFLVGGVVNFFVPSGGGQWTLQGPVFVEAAQRLGTEVPLVVMGIAYGDQWTNLIHPFTAIIPSLITGVSVPRLFGYTLFLFAASAVVLGTGLMLWPIALS